MKFRPNRFNSVQLTERTQNCIKECYKGNNFKNEHARTMVLVHDMSTCLKVLYKCMKFHSDTSTCYQFKERTRNSIANDQR